MKYNVVSYLIGEGFRNIFKNKKSTVTALTTMCLCMLVFGIFFIIGENINNIMNTIEDAQGMKVYFKSTTEEERIREIGKSLEKIDGINKIQYESKEDGLNQIKESFKDNASALDGVEFKNMEAAYKITLSDLSRNEAIQNEIKIIVGNDLSDITSSNEEIAILMSIGRAIRVFTFILLLILVTISLVIIGNTIKLTVHARRKEISIMKYVGATNSFIRWPFIVEGIIIGVASALITVLILGLTYNAITGSMLQSDLAQTLGLKLVTFKEMFNLIIIVYLGLGIGMGILGSPISMRKYLEV